MIFEVIITIAFICACFWLIKQSLTEVSEGEDEIVDENFND